MSWTSEFELPSQGPQVVSDSPQPDDDDQPEEEPPTEDQELTAEDQELTAEDQEPPAKQATSLADIPDEGPLDPSVFDGLFDDLIEHDEEPAVAPDVETATADSTAVEDTTPEDGSSEPNGAVLDSGEAAEPEHEEIPLEPLEGAFTIGDLFVDEAPPVDDLLDDNVFRPVDDDDDYDESLNETAVETELEPDNEEADYETDAEYDAEYEEDAEAPNFDTDLDTEPEYELDAAVEDESFEDVEYYGDDQGADDAEHDDLDEDSEDGSGDSDGLDEPFADSSRPDDNGGEPAIPIAAPQLPVLDQPLSPTGEQSPPSDNGHRAPAEPLLVGHQPIQAVATSPPIALDEPGPAANGVTDAPVHFDVPAAEVVDRYHPPAYDAPARTRRWPSFVTAVLIGGGLGIGGAIALIALQQPAQENNSPTTPVVVANGVDQPVTDGSDTDQAAAAATDGGTTEPVTGFLGADGSLLLNSLGFKPGTTELTEASQQTLQQIAAVLAELPPEPTVLAVRTFSEASAQANRDLSVNQAEALSQYLSTLGVEFGGLSVRGLGAAPLGQPLPVENFVAVNPNLGADDLRRSLGEVGPFDIGVDADTLELRPESVMTLDRVGVAMAAGQGTISLAGYSYDRPNDEANKALARTAVEAAREYLAAAHEIDQARISVLAPGPLPYVVSQEHGGHVTIKRGRAAAVDVAIHSGDSSVLSFASGSDALSGGATEELTRLSALLAESGTNAVISVRSAGEATAEANLRLSELQAEAISEFFLDTGLAEGQVRVYGVGDVARHRWDDASSEVTVTVLG